MPDQPSPAQLLVEGQNDQHVVWALCQRHNVRESFSVVVPSDPGFDGVVTSIPVRLMRSELQALGIVVDADQNLQGHWDAICGRLRQEGYDNLPPAPERQGCVLECEGKPRVGVWIMPDNRLPGMLEDFVTYLVPEDDVLLEQARSCLEDIEAKGWCRYREVHHAKALIHTWLAWQENPGQPMGQAITSKALLSDSDLALLFVGWLNRLFNP